MINLLPPDIQENTNFARRNSQLRKWIAALLFGIAGIAAIVAAGSIYINQATAAQVQQAETTQAQLGIQKFSQTQKRVQDISASLKLVLQVLGKEVLFSELLKQIGAVIPEDTVLTGLSINKVQGGIDLQAAARDYQSATQVQVNLQDPANKIFDKADLINIQCNSADGIVGDPNSVANRYPCNVTIRAQFSKNNPDLVVEDKKATP